MKLKIFLLIFMLSLVAPVRQSDAQAPKVNSNSNLPEEAGLYDVAGHPDMKLRVFVYQAKPDKPGKPGPVAPQYSCGQTSVLDPDSSSPVSPAGWKLPGAWTYNLNTVSVPASVGSANFATIAANSFAAWQPYAGSAVAIKLGAADTLATKATRDNINIIAWGHTSGTALAVSYIWYQNGVALEIDTIFNSNFSWYWSDPSKWGGKTCAWTGVYDAQNILTHELGHTFGLDDEYADDYANNTMYGYGSKGETKKDTLTQGDIAGVNALNY
jgi:hypothetical protein